MWLGWTRTSMLTVWTCVDHHIGPICLIIPSWFSDDLRQKFTSGQAPLWVNSKANRWHSDLAWILVIKLHLLGRSKPNKIISLSLGVAAQIIRSFWSFEVLNSEQILLTVEHMARERTLKAPWIYYQRASNGKQITSFQSKQRPELVKMGGFIIFQHVIQANAALGIWIFLVVFPYYH